VWGHHVRAAVYRITKFMIPLYHRCTEVDVPISYNSKIYNESQEINCRRVGLSPTWLSPRWLIAEMTAHRWNLPWYRCCSNSHPSAAAKLIGKADAKKQTSLSLMSWFGRDW